MSRLDINDAVRIPASSRDAILGKPIVDAIHVWVAITHKDIDDIQTYRAEGGAIAVCDKTDDELHLEVTEDVARALWMSMPEREEW